MHGCEKERLEVSMLQIGLLHTLIDALQSIDAIAGSCADQYRNRQLQVFILKAVGP